MASTSFSFKDFLYHQRVDINVSFSFSYAERWPRHCHISIQFEEKNVRNFSFKPSWMKSLTQSAKYFRSNPITSQWITTDIKELTWSRLLNCTHPCVPQLRMRFRWCALKSNSMMAPDCGLKVIFTGEGIGRPGSKSVVLLRREHLKITPTSEPTSSVSGSSGDSTAPVRTTSRSLLLLTRTDWGKSRAVMRNPASKASRPFRRFNVQMNIFPSIPSDRRRSRAAPRVWEGSHRTFEVSKDFRYSMQLQCRSIEAGIEVITLNSNNILKEVGEHS